MGDVNITVPDAYLEITGYPPTFGAPSDPVNIVVPTVALGIVSYPPEVTTPIVVPAAALTITGYAPTVTATQGLYITVSTAELVITGKVPIVISSATGGAHFGDFSTPVQMVQYGYLFGNTANLPIWDPGYPGRLFLSGGAGERCIWVDLGGGTFSAFNYEWGHVDGHPLRDTADVVFSGVWVKSITVTTALVHAGNHVLAIIRRTTDNESYVYTVNITNVSNGSFKAVVMAAVPGGGGSAPSETVKLDYVVCPFSNDPVT